MYALARTAVAAALAATLLAGVASAQGLEGSKAPALGAKEWINAEEGMTLEKLKGNVIFLEFTATW